LSKKVADDILLIDKPKGITSFDVIRRLRKEFGRGAPKLGHAGTLDPLASGLMLVGVGKGTKKLKEYLKLSKVYEVEVVVGERRSTGDMEGKIVEEKAVGHLDTELIEDTLQGTVGVLILPVPLYSAIKIKGRPLYERARKGEKVELPEKKMHIYWIKLLDVRKENERFVLTILLEVSSGTYIRSIAEEIGRRLGYPATVQELRRTKINDFDVNDAKKLEI